VQLIDGRAARIFITALLFALVLGFLYAARETLFAFLFAVFFAYLVSPVITTLERWLRGRGRAIAVLYTVLLGAIIVFFVAMGPRIGREAARLGQSLPTLISQVSSGQIAQQLGQQHGWNYHTTELIRQFLATHRDGIEQVAQRVGLRGAEVAQQSWLLLIVPILSIFFLRDGRSFSDVLLASVQSTPQREFLEGVLNDLNQMLAHFIRAQLTLAGLSMLAYGVVLSVLQVPNALVLSLAGGMLEFIPLVGPLLAAVIILGVALLTGFQHPVLLAIPLVVWRMVQDYVISPRVMGKSVELHPLAALFGIMAGGEVGGILGVYLSIPVMASLRIVLRRWRLYVEKRRFGPLHHEFPFSAEASPRK
jgi:predicted PurR-regulated permease PerM